MHVLGREVRGIAIGRQRAAVLVHVRGRHELVVQPDRIMALKPDALITRVPSTVTVVSEDGKPIVPGAGAAFFVTTETFDPCHLVCELPAGGP